MVCTARVADRELTGAAVDRGVHGSTIGSIHHEIAVLTRLHGDSLECARSTDNRLTSINILIAVGVAKTIHPLSQETASQLLALELAQTVILEFVVIAVLRARCIDATNAFTALARFALLVNDCIDGTAIDTKSPPTASVIISSIKVNPFSLFISLSSSWLSRAYLTPLGEELSGFGGRIHVISVKNQRSRRLHSD